MDVHDGLAGQAGQQPSDRLRSQRPAGRHPFGRAEAEPSAQHRQPSEQAAFGVVEQLIAPRDQRLRRPVSPRAGRTAGQNRAASSAGSRAGHLAAASSMAKGMPSSRAHTCATAAELCADSSKAGLAAAARTANSMPASDAATVAPEPSAGSPSGGTGKTSSPGTSRRSLLVARNRTRRHWASSEATRPAAASRTCRSCPAPPAAHGRPAHAPGRRPGRHIPFGHSQRLRDAGRDQRGIGEQGQLDQPGAVAKAGLGERRHPQRQPGLATPARASQRDDPGHAKAFKHSSYLRDADHQRVHLGRQP
jgi:hypothetical protein